jgi:hypothetical protein
VPIAGIRNYLADIVLCLQRLEERPVSFLPFLKLAHLVYRTVAMAYNEWSGRK